jgi:hypothetical protein
MKMNEFVSCMATSSVANCVCERCTRRSLEEMKVEYTITCPIKLIKSSVHMHSNPL